MDASPELFVTLPNKVRLCYQTFGNPTDPAVIFIAGHGGSLLEWNEDMLRLFSPAPSRRYLIRFDARDTGLSTEFPVPAGYDLSDMAGDVDGLIAHLGLSVKGVHLVGASMGGPIAYILAARNPQQVRSLTLLYASPGASEDLPLKPLVDLPMPPMGFGDMKREYVKFNMAQYDALVTQPNADDRTEYEALVTRVTEREMRAGTLYSKGPNHGAAGFAPRPGVEILKDITSPSTVIQAAHDQFFGVEHGEALAKGLPNSEYVLLEDVGHELPRRIWGRLAEVLLQTWKRGDDAWVAE